jgi:cytochrome c oxidase accessory protein FixG
LSILILKRSMINEYFTAKKRLYIQSVKGRFRSLKTKLNYVFLSIYSFAPFIRYNRGEGVSDQAILIDITNSKVFFFFIEIWPQEAYYLAGILIISAVMLFFITSLFGRVWCGYACFQTVWTDIFVAIEKLFQGDRNDRILLDRKNNFQKYLRKTLTHLCWIALSLLTGFLFTCYFNNSLELVNKLLNGNLSLKVTGWIFGIAGMTYIMAGFAREHVCTYMCPYARFQSVMFDNNTLIISYDKNRGEPRGKWKQGDSFENRGHCIDCKQCLVVCPTGIDIRNGLQMECIACGLCIDACDNIMSKVGLPKGLIRYDTLSNLLEPSQKKEFKILKPRTFYYVTILLIVSSIMLSSLVLKAKIEISINPDRNPLYVKLSDGSIRNGYEIKITNKTYSKQSFRLLVKNQNQLISTSTNLDLNNLEVDAQSEAFFKIFLTISKNYLGENNIQNIQEMVVEFEIIDNDKNEIYSAGSKFIFN